MDCCWVVQSSLLSLEIPQGPDFARLPLARCACLQAALQELLGLLAADRDVARDLLVTAHAPLADRQAALRVHLNPATLP